MNNNTRTFGSINNYEQQEQNKRQAIQSSSSYSTTPAYNYNNNSYNSSNTTQNTNINPNNAILSYLNNNNIDKSLLEKYLEFFVENLNNFNLENIKKFFNEKSEIIINNNELIGVANISNKYNEINNNQNAQYQLHSYKFLIEGTNRASLFICGYIQFTENGQSVVKSFIQHMNIEKRYSNIPLIKNSILELL